MGKTRAQHSVLWLLLASTAALLVPPLGQAQAIGQKLMARGAQERPMPLPRTPGASPRPIEIPPMAEEGAGRPRPPIARLPTPAMPPRGIEGMMEAHERASGSRNSSPLGPSAPDAQKRSPQSMLGEAAKPPMMMGPMGWDKSDPLEKTPLPPHVNMPQVPDVQTLPATGDQ